MRGHFWVNHPTCSIISYYYFVMWFVQCTIAEFFLLRYFNELLLENPTTDTFIVLLSCLMWWSNHVYIYRKQIILSDLPSILFALMGSFWVSAIYFTIPYFPTFLSLSVSVMPIGAKPSSQQFLKFERHYDNLSSQKG
jgi:hypothetical protein